MGGICVGAVAGITVQIFDRKGNLIARNAREGVNKVSSISSLTEAERIIAMATGAGVEGFAETKALGKGGLSGISLFTLHAKRAASPFPNAPTHFDPAPGSTMVEDEDDQDEVGDVDEDGRLKKNLDFALERARKKKAAQNGMSVRYPNGETSSSKKGKK